MTGGNKNDDFDIGSFADGDDDFDSLFKDAGGSPEQNLLKELISEIPVTGESARQKTGETAAPEPAKKRTALDFEPDMDALLMTAQSAMIIEGMNFFTRKDFSADTLQIYVEALKGVEFFIKILNRNPNNYKKLKNLIDSDEDCRKVEKIAFNLYRKICDDIAETEKEKIAAFELLYKLLKSAVDKATITKSMQIAKKYNNISGELNTDKLQQLFRSDDTGLKIDIKNLNEHVKIALDFIKKGKTVITAGMKGRDINIYIINATALLTAYYRLAGNSKVSDYYDRINSLHKKYFVVQE